MIEARWNVPAGKIRVLAVDLFSREERVVKDCDTPEEAFKIADKHNIARENSMDDVCYVYDDNGDYIRGNEAVGKIGVSP